MKIIKDGMFIFSVFTAGRWCSLLFIAFLVATHTGAEEYVPGSYDQEVLRLLKQSKSVLPLRETRLSDEVHVHNVSAGEDLPWPEAVSMAEERFSEDVDLRALFLWQFVQKGMSSDILSEFGQPKIVGKSIILGGPCISYGLEVTVEARSMKIGVSPNGVPRDVPFTIDDEKAMLLFRAKDNADATGPLLGPGELKVKRLICRGISFDGVTFDVERWLTGHWREVELSEEGITLNVGGHISESGGSDFYAMVISKHKMREKIEYNPDLTMKYRSVRQPGTRRTKYLETYKDGKLYRRIHYGPKETDGVIRHETLRVEEFE